MNSVEKVKALCKERKIPVSRLEKDLGFGNGYISQLKRGVFPADRLLMIAKYFGVSAENLLEQGENEQQKKAPSVVTGSRAEKIGNIVQLAAMLSDQDLEELHAAIIDLTSRRSRQAPHR